MFNFKYLKNSFKKRSCGCWFELSYAYTHFHHLLHDYVRINPVCFDNVCYTFNDIHIRV